MCVDTELYVTSDGPMPGDEIEVGAVRAYLNELTGFKRIHRIYRDKNDRSMNWSIRRDLLNDYGAIIQIEEDCVCSPFYLEFMNAALRRYQNDSNVFAICGYLCPVRIERPTRVGVYRIPRFSAWGFGIWKESDALVRESVELDEFKELRQDRRFLNLAKKETGVDYIANLWRVANRGLFAYDLMATLEVMKRGMTCVYPSESLIDNIGHDGSGEHCKMTNRFGARLATSLPDVACELPVSSAGMRRHAVFRSGGLRKYLHYRLRLIRGKYQ